MPSLVNIEAEIQAMLDLAEYDLDEEKKQALEEYIAELGEQEADKVDRMVAFVRHQLELAEYCRKEAQRLQKKARAAEEVSARLKAHYMAIMTANGLEKIKGNAYTLRIGKTEVVDIPDDWDGIDDKFLKVTVEPRKADIKKALKAGETVGGCTLKENYFLRIY